jgi:hypothetical protein
MLDEYNDVLLELEIIKEYKQEYKQNQVEEQQP